MVTIKRDIPLVVVPLGHRVVSRTAPGVTAANTLDAEPCAFDGAILLDSFKCILRACGREAACSRCKRGDAALVEADHRDEQVFHASRLSVFDVVLEVVSSSSAL